MVTDKPEGGLTLVEQSLVEHVDRGERLDLITDDEVVDEAAMRSWGESRTCRASVIRDILRGRLTADPDPRGLRFRGARITGRLDLQSLTTDVHLELKDCLLEEGVLAEDARMSGFDLEGCQLEHSSEPPLDCSRLTCSTLNLEGAKVISHASTCAVRLTGAQIGGRLNCRGAQLRNDSGPAVVGDYLQVGQDVRLTDGFTATGSGNYAALRLRSAHIDGDLIFAKAELRNDSGPALLADGLQLGQNMLLDDGFTATGSGDRGVVRLTGAHIDGDLIFAKAELRNDSGPALLADGLQLGQNMLLDDGFTVTGSGDRGAVRLTGAHIGGNFVVFDRARLRNDSGPALLANGLQVDQLMFLFGGFIGGGEAVVVNLASARVCGALRFRPAVISHKVDTHRLLLVDGLTYPGVPVGHPRTIWDWGEMLREHTPYYAAQPYQQLAAGYRALGDDKKASQTLIMQREDQLAHSYAGWPWLLWGRITKITLGYGYQPWRALLFLAGVVAMSCLLAIVLGAHGALAQTSKTATPSRSCTVVQQISVGLDLNLPVGTSVARPECDLTTDSASVTAAWLTIAGWVLRLLAWTFAALFIAGFTSAVRKT